MRYLLVFSFAVACIGVPFSVLAGTTPSGSQSAPADEYFGHSNESVLGIRNELDAFDSKSDGEMLSHAVSIELDDVQDCVLAWQQKYPNDPWLPRMMSRMIKDYARAGEASSPHAIATLQIMTTMYPDAPETQAAIAAIGSETSPSTNTVLAAAVADVDVPSAAPADPAPVVATQNAPGDLASTPAWVAFNSRRSNDYGSAPQVVNEEATIAGDVVDASTGDPVPGAVVFVSPNRDANDITSTPFASTTTDGSFSVEHVPLGGPLNAGMVSLSHAEYVVVEPPRGSNYAPYHGMIDGSDGTVQAGVIRLSTL
jgi:hypothetical protein